MIAVLVLTPVVLVLGDVVLITSLLDTDSTNDSLESLRNAEHSKLCKLDSWRQMYSEITTKKVTKLVVQSKKPLRPDCLFKTIVFVYSGSKNPEFLSVSATRAA